MTLIVLVVLLLLFLFLFLLLLLLHIVNARTVLVSWSQIGYSQVKTSGYSGLR